MPKKKEEAEKEEKIDVEVTEEVVEEKLKGKDLEKAAEEESTKDDLAKKKELLLKKAAKLKKKLSAEGPVTEDLKAQVKAKKKTDMLIPLEEYVKSGIYLGTKVVTPDMRPFVYRRRADGLAIFNTDIIDEKLKEGVEYLCKFNAEDIILVCKRQAGWRAARKFEQLTKIRTFTKKYPAGVLTNTTLPEFFENK